MGGVHATSRNHGWQFILADLALILFLITLTGLPTDTVSGSAQVALAKATLVPLSPSAPVGAVEVASAQSLYRPITGGPTIAQWLAAQPNDPRATLTIFARYHTGTVGEEDAVWADAQALAAETAASGLAIRTIIAAGAERDIYASLAYDAPFEGQP